MLAVALPFSHDLKGLFVGEESKEITGRHPRLAELARAFSGQLTSRVAARKSGVSYDTIQRIWNGDRPKADTLQRFCEGMRFTPEQTAQIMQAAGYATFQMLVGQDVLHGTAPVSDSKLAMIVRAYETGSRSDQELLYEMSRRIARDELPDGVEDLTKDDDRGTGN
jgi:transcriptional regulator with XRE-family HTH domain